MNTSFSNIINQSYSDLLDIPKEDHENWIKDETTHNCYTCRVKFTLLNRKHHCRNCGKFFAVNVRIILEKSKKIKIFIVIN